MIRALIADPQLPQLSRAGQAEEIRPCIACNQGCQVRSVMNVLLSCTVNPDVLATQTSSLQEEGHIPTKKPHLVSSLASSTILIIGGGPAGMEAARTAALRGRRVLLYERDATLGGTVALAA